MHSPWNALPAAKVHLAVWHHFSTLLDMHLLNLIENTFFFLSLSLFDLHILTNRQPSRQNEKPISISTSLEYVMESCLSRNERRRLSSVWPKKAGKAVIRKTPGTLKNNMDKAIHALPRTHGLVKVSICKFSYLEFVNNTNWSGTEGEREREGEKWQLEAIQKP